MKKCHCEPHSNYQKVRDFHKVFRAPLDQKYSFDLAKTRADLIYEEYCEVSEELDRYSKDRLAKELADLLYVTYGTAAAFGIDIDKVFEKVHQNNMSKLQPDGTVKYRKDGKILKPEGYVPVDLETILD